MTKTKDIIESLKDDTLYYGDFGKQYLSNSDIDKLLNNPKQFRKPEAHDTNRLTAFAFGRYFHHSFLEPDKAMQTLCVDVASRNSKAYKEFLLSNEVDHALLGKECTQVVELVEEVNSNYECFDLIHAEGNIYEQPGIKEIKGQMWKGKADIITDEFIVDLKTTSKINDFYWSARKFNYDSQAYIYEQIFGKPMKFIVVDKITKMVGIFDVTEEAIQRGEEKVERAVEVYQKFFGENPTEEISNYIIRGNI